jgi:nucleoside-diphosphate-sugar epimerase
MRFIITGGTGFIGHNVVKLLTAQGHDCFVIDNATDYGFIPADELNYLQTERSKRMNAGVHRISITDFAAIEAFVSNFAALTDCVIHLASFPRQKVVNDSPVMASEVMSTGLVNLLELTAKYKIPKFVYISSSMVYGDFENNVLETAVCNPQGQYGIMKYMGEKLVEDYSRRGFFDHVIVRPSAVYGELDVEDRVVSKFIIAALRGNTLRVNGPDEVLDFTHVDDTAQGIVLAATTDAAANSTFNITRSNPDTYTLLDAAKLAVDIAGQGTIQVNNRDMSFPSRGRLNIDLAREVLGYNPQINIEEGFKRYYNWFSESEFWKTKI